MTPCLELDGDLHELTPETIVGSGAQASWRIAGKDLAARHFTLRLEGTGARLIPASERSVVTVNGQQVPKVGTAVSSGDRIAAGQAQFLFLASAGDRRPAAPPAPGEAYLVELATRQAYHLRKRTVEIGREATSGIVLRDATVSRHHADVRAEAGGYVLYTSGAAGTQVNGQRIAAPRFLHEGDVVQIGGAKLSFTHTLLPQYRVLEPAEREEDALSRRPTVLHQSAVPTGEVAAFRQQGINRALLAAAVMATLAAVVAALR